MASQKSNEIATKAVAPKRRRGHDRVKAILEAATDLFATRPYDAVTMTEVAARSETAIGSLYRFFPTKEALADALLDRYGARLAEALDAIAEQAGALAPESIAEALVDFMHGLERERSAALGLIDTRPDSLALRAMIRGAMLDRIAAILVAIGGGAPAGVRPQATLLLNVLKAVRALDQDERVSGERAALDRESRRLVRLYLEDISRTPR